MWVRSAVESIESLADIPGDSVIHPFGFEMRRGGSLSDRAFDPALSVRGRRNSRGAQPAVFPGVTNRTEPKTARQWLRYRVVAAIALLLVWWMLRLFII